MRGVSVIPWYTSWQGLLGTKKPKPVFFQTRFGIHTFGMRYPIDVVILDRKYIVRKIVKNLPPNRFFFWNPRYDYVLELPVQTVVKERIVLGKNCRLPLRTAYGLLLGGIP